MVMRADEGTATTGVSWFWDWVPPTGSDPVELARWSEHLAGLLDDWVGGKVAAARDAWPDDAEEEFPFTVGEMGRAVARDLLERANGLPENCRLIWGAGFVGDQARWLPVLVLAEFRQASEDPAYLMAVVGVDGFADDVREPSVEYVTTEHGDGIRVLALTQVEGEGLRGRVNAALRLEARATAADPAENVDVLLTTRVAGMDQLAVIGPGVEVLMHMIATQYAARPDDGVPALRFVPAVAQGRS